jgi:hypothetical protein
MNIETQAGALSGPLEPRVAERRRFVAHDSVSVDLDNRAVERWENEGGRCAGDARVVRHA